jgi:hypothetical protein
MYGVAVSQNMEEHKTSVDLNRCKGIISGRKSEEVCARWENLRYEFHNCILPPNAINVTYSCTKSRV